MTFAQSIAFLRQFNRWRRGDENLEQPCARKAGEAIDEACTYMEQLNESNAVLLEDMRHYRGMAEELLEKNAKQAVMLVRLKNALQEIATLDTSQDASPRQCAAVLLAMNALEQ
jgi:hypothetical protein